MLLHLLLIINTCLRVSTTKDCGCVLLPVPVYSTFAWWRWHGMHARTCRPSWHQITQHGTEAACGHRNMLPCWPSVQKACITPHASHAPHMGTSRQQQEASDRQPTKTAPNRRTVLGSFVPPACSCLFCSGSSSSDQLSGWYGRYFAWAMANTMEVYEEAVAGLKQQIFSELLQSGNGVHSLLEVGIGTGPNFKYYAAAGQQPKLITGLDPNPAMQPYARQNAQTAGLSDRVRLVEASADAMPFDNSAFDAAVITLVLCSVPDAVAALQEVRRVLKPGGHLLLVEHVVAQPEQRWLRMQQELFNPLQRALADGCNLNRDTLAAVEAAGFGVAGVRRLQIEGLGPLSPHMAGIAAA